MLGLLTAKTELQNKIELLKNKMINSGLELGLTNPVTVKISQELDRLIIEYQRLPY